MSSCFRPHESQHARPPCPSPTPRVHSDSRPSSQWCHPAISFSVVPFSSCPQSLPASESFPMSQLIAWGGQSTEVSASASLPPKKSQYFYNYNVIRFIRILSSQIKMCFMIALCGLFWDLMKIPVQMQSYVTEMSDSRLKCSVLLELSKVLKKTLSSV